MVNGTLLIANVNILKARIGVAKNVGFRHWDSW